MNEVSKCGYACYACSYGKAQKCLMCTEHNGLTKGCGIFGCQVLRGRRYETCLECDKRLNCPLYKDSLRHCPLRIELLGKA